MSDIIYNKISIAKENIYSTIISLMKGAGWEDISSSASTDFVVLNSKGANGDKNLFVQFRNYWNSPNYDIETTSFPAFEYRFIENYTPGSGTSAGTFKRPSVAWLPAILVGNRADAATFPMRTICDFYYHVDANGFVGIIEPPQSLDIKTNMVYIRNPINEYCKSTGSQGMVTFYSYAYACNYSDKVSTGNNTNIELEQYCTLSPVNPNMDGKYTMSELLLGNATEGVRFKIDEFYCVPNKNIVHGDIININEEKYKVFFTYGPFPSTYVALRIE